MLTLSGRGTIASSSGAPWSGVVRIATSHRGSNDPHEGWLISSESIPTGYSSYLAHPKDAAYLDRVPSSAVRIVLPAKFEYLSEGDVLGVQADSGEIRTLYRKA